MNKKTSSSALPKNRLLNHSTSKLTFLIHKIRNTYLQSSAYTRSLILLLGDKPKGILGPVSSTSDKERALHRNHNLRWFVYVRFSKGIIKGLVLSNSKCDTNHKRMEPSAHASSPNLGFSSRYLPHTNHSCYKRPRSFYGKEISFIKAMNSHHLRPEFLRCLCKTDIYLLWDPYQVQHHNTCLNFPGQAPSGLTNTPDIGVRDHWCLRPKASLLPHSKAPQLSFPKYHMGRKVLKMAKFWQCEKYRTTRLNQGKTAHFPTAFTTTVSPHPHLWLPNEYPYEHP